MPSSSPFSRLTRRELAQCLAGLGVACAWPARMEAQAGRAQFQMNGETLTLSNPLVAMRWSAAAGRLRALRFSDLSTRQAVPLAPDLFTLVLAGGRAVRSSELSLAGRVESGRVAGDPKSIRRAGQRPGVQVSATFRDAASGATVKWRALLLDGSRYLRQEFEITSGAQDLPIREIVLWDCDVPGVQEAGTVKGSPAVAGQTWLAFEHPLSTTTVAGSRVRCVLSRQLSLIHI